MDVALTASLVAPIRARQANGPHGVIIDLARGLAARGHRTTVYAAEGSSIPGVRVVESPVPADALAAQVMPGRSTSPSADLWEAFADLFAAVHRGAHDVVLQHAFDTPAIELSDGLRVLHVLHLPPIVPAVVAGARATSAPLATVSASARTAWEEAGVRVSCVLPNGVRDRGYAVGPVQPAALVAGRISPEKGTAVAIRAAIAAGLTPWVVGDPYDPDYFRDEVSPLLGSARYFGAITRAALSRLMGRTAVTLMPVLWSEPFGLVAAEAQMAGCPVVAYRRGALPEVVQDGVSGFVVEPDDEDGLVMGIQAAMSLDRRAVRASARPRLGIARMLDAYESVMPAVASGALTTWRGEARLATSGQELQGANQALELR